MSTPWLPQNPGIIIGELTDNELLVIQNLAGLPYQDGDIVYWDNGQFQRLPIGSNTEVLTVTSGLPAWEAAGGGTVDGSGTTNELTYWVDSDTLGALAVATYPSLTELSYVKGVTSALQTQINAKADSSGSLTQFVGNTAWRVFYSDANGDVTELALGADGTFLKSNGAAAAPSFATPTGSGDVSKVGTPVNNQVGVWTGDGTLEGDADLTFDTATNTLATGIVTVSDEAYGAGWNGSLQVPTKNAIYDKIETISGGGITEELAIAYAVAL